MNDNQDTRRAGLQTPGWRAPWGVAIWVALAGIVIAADGPAEAAPSPTIRPSLGSDNPLAPAPALPPPVGAAPPAAEPPRPVPRPSHPPKKPRKP